MIIIFGPVGMDCLTGEDWLEGDRSMQYMGSKARHAKELLSIVLKNRKPGQWYVEPFVGGANMIDKVDGNRLGADVNPHLICLLEAIRDGWTPPENVSEDVYNELSERRLVDPITAAVGFGCSFGGKFFGGYARGKNRLGGWRNYAAETKRNLLKQAPRLCGVIFKNCSYQDLEIPQNSIIYCDPPYAGTTKYATGDFNHEEFWQWCRDKVEEGHEIFVSEYTAPDDWICVWEKKTSANFHSNRSNASERTEKLFVHESALNKQEINP